MFKHGETEHQKSMFDQDMQYPPHVQKMLENSWAASFYQHIFTQINEDHFKVLYSDQPSRPNKPVNVLISLLVLRN